MTAVEPLYAGRFQTLAVTVPDGHALRSVVEVELGMRRPSVSVVPLEFEVIWFPFESIIAEFGDKFDTGTYRTPSRSISVPVAFSNRMPVASIVSAALYVKTPFVA